ncbi:hypothetical protein [Inquilinus limosus]|uniref:hypothetical protein n=1 Tax=Inquilinus limosus TaxID=171674 RepID=UPI0011982516|nr:hypothetical protein [Inquilinus limosus]
MWPSDLRVRRVTPFAAQAPAKKTDPIFVSAVDKARQPPVGQPITDGKDDRTTFGPDDPALGVYGAGVTPLKWPFRIFADAGVDPTDNTALRGQMAATGVLDPKAFGTRPAASPDAEYELQPGQMVWALDKTRMASLEEQRGLLAKVEDPKNAGDKAKLTEQLQDSVIREIDYAATQQAVPDFDALVAPLAQRAPNDPTYKAALDAARTHFDNRWKTEGRTPDQIGRLIADAKDGKYDDVTAETRRQLVAIADATKSELGDKATPEALAAAIDKRAGVYLTFDASNAADPKTSAYLDAVRQGQAEATKEVLVDRPIAEVRKAAGLDPKGTDVPPLNERQTTDLLKKLAEVTDPQHAMPQQVQDILSDPRIFSQDPKTPGLLNQAVDRMAHWKPGGDGPYDDMVPNLAHIVQNLSATDGGKPGKGKTLVDALASQILSKVPAQPKYDGTERNMFADAQYFGTELRRAAGKGDVALSLAVAGQADKAGDTDQTKHKDDKYYHNFYHALRDASVDAARAGIEDFGGSFDKQGQQLIKDAGFFAHPLANYGQGRSKAQQAQDIAAMRKADPDAAKKYDATAAEYSRMVEVRQGITQTVDAYKQDLAGIEGFDRKVENGSPLRPETKQESVIKAADAMPKPLGDEPKNPDTTPSPSIWFQRSERNFTTHFTLEGLKAVLPQDKYLYARYATLGTDGLSPQEVARVSQAGGGDWFNPRLLSRFSGGLSTYLFEKNALSLADDPTSQWNDYLYVPVHASMGASALASTVLPDSWKEAIWSNDPKGLANTPFNQRYNAALGRIDKLAVSDGTKAFLRGAAAGMLKNVPDTAYILVDGANSVANFFQYDDWVKGVGYGVSVLGDAAFVVSASATVSEAIGGSGLILGLGATAWTGIGAALMLIGSGIVYFKGRYDTAHTYDAADQRYLEYLNVPKDVAQTIAYARTTDEGGRSTGLGLTAVFDRLGKSNQDMIALLKRLTPDQAKALATNAKNIKLDSDGKPVLTQDDESYLALPMDPTKSDVSRYSVISYNGQTKRWEDPVTRMYWTPGAKRWVFDPKISNSMGTIPPQQDPPVSYDPATGTLQRSSTYRLVQPESVVGLENWMFVNGMLG